MKIRYFFDTGSGICLWAADEESRLKYDYPIELELLPISKQLVREGYQLIKEYDTDTDWNDPGGQPLWSAEQRENFENKSRRFYQKLVNELSSDYEVLNEVRV